ncbi:hypothetical protein [Chondromyces crocatus]|uniref:hypothetical protein n=1 Tax=Chondromyces crocatus TaxID=52 RepID=UPI00067BA548|nr:hypothetical protein [Chondromyces crocatus]
MQRADGTVFLLACCLLACGVLGGCGIEAPQKPRGRENAGPTSTVQKHPSSESTSAGRRTDAAGAARTTDEPGQAVVATDAERMAASKAWQGEQRRVLQAFYAGLSRAEREQAMRAVCLSGCDEEKRKAILDASPASERAALTALASRTQAEGSRTRSEEASAAPRREAPVAPRRPAPQSAGRVCCCDGTLSKTCTTVKSGCCSRHGGVCPCH